MTNVTKFPVKQKKEEPVVLASLVLRYDEDGDAYLSPELEDDQIFEYLGEQGTDGFEISRMYLMATMADMLTEAGVLSRVGYEDSD